MYRSIDARKAGRTICAEQTALSLRADEQLQRRHAGRHLPAVDNSHQTAVTGLIAADVALQNATCIDDVLQQLSR
jgi:hypothetical protein